MARKTFDEILKDREKEKKNGTYNTGTDSNERPTADEVIAKREYAIQKRRYKSDFYQGGRKKDRNAGVKYSKSGAYVETSGGTGTWEEQKHRSEYTGNTLYGTKGLFGKEYFGTKPKVPTYQEMKAKSTGEKPKSKESKKYIGEYEAVRELKNLGVSDEDIAKIKKRKLGKSDWSVELESARKIKQTEKERKAGTYVDESYRKYLDNIKQQTSELESIGGNTEEIAKKKDWLNKQHENIKILNDKETAEIVEKYAELKDSNEISSRLRNEAKGLQSPKVAEFDRLTDDLKKKGYDEKQINSLYDTYKRIKNAKASKQYEQNLEKDLKKGKTLHNLLSHGSQILSGAGLFEVANRAASELVTGEYNPVDTNSPLFRPSDYTNIVRQKTEEEIEDKAKGPAGKGLGMLYSGATSTIDSLLGAGAFGQAGALGVMGVGAAANSTKSTFERTADTKKSAITGAAAGIIEVATEKMGLDNLWDIVRGSGKAAARNAFVNFAVQSGIEGTEEITSEIANTVVDGIVNGGMSEYMTNIRKYMSEGYSEEEATKLAEREFALQCAESFAVGTISGGISGGIGAGAERLQTGMFGQSAMDSGTIEDVAQRAESYDDYYVQKALNNYKAKQSPYAAGKLMNEVARAEENPEQLILKSTTVEENPVDKVKNAESIEDMVEAVKEAELNGTPEEVEMVKGAYEYQKAKLMSSGAVTTEQVIAAENNLTQTEAYQLGRTGQQAEPERLSEKSMAAYQRGVQEYQAERETIYNREDGALNARTEEGKQFEVKGIKTIENEPVLETDSGDVKLSEVQFENEATQMLFNNASTQKSDEAAKVYVECYPAGVTVSSYNRQFDRFLTAGRLGVPFHNLTKENTPMKQMIGVVNLAKIYNAGRDMEQEQRKRETSANVKKKGQGKVIDKRSDKSEHPLMSVYEQLAKKTGQDIILKDSDMEGINGYFQKSMSEIVLNVNSDQQYATLFHEALGEFSEAWNDEGMKVFQEDLLEWYLEQYGESAKETIERYKEVYEEAEGSKSYREAANEMVNDALVSLFQSEEGIQDFADWLNENKTQEETQTVLQKLAELIKEICDKIKSFIQNEQLSNTAKAAMQMEVEKAAELRKRLLEIADQAIENYQSTEVGDVDGETKSSLVGTDENGIEIYETSAETKKLSYSERRKALLSSMMEEFKERTAKFQKNGKTYYASYDESGVRKGIYGDKKSDKGGLKAKINIGADGNYIELAENALYNSSGKEQGKKTASGFHDNAKSWDYFVKKIKSDGKFYDVLINVKDTGKEHFVYDITLKEADSLPSHKGLYDGNSPASKKSISQNSENTTDNKKFSLKVDSEGRELTKEQQEFFKDSKVRDENGNLQVMYHGTPQGGFTVFKNDLQFFTANKEYANIYQSPSASSRKSGKNAGNPQTYEVYLNIKKPFDIRNPETKEMFINEYVKGGYALGINPYVEYKDTTKTGLPSWEEADNIYEFLEDNELLDEYDGIFVDEGGILDENGGVKDRGISYVVFNPNQIKNVDNLNPTEDDDIRYSLKVDIDQELKTYGIENKLNDYIAVQKAVISNLKNSGFFEQNREIINVETGMVIGVNPRGIRETLGNGKRFQNLPRRLKILKLVTIKSLPEIIQNGTLIEGDVENIHGESPVYTYFETPIEINGEKVKVKVDIRKTVATNKFWIHNVILEKDSELLNPTNKQGLHEIQNPSDNGIASKNKDVKKNIRHSLTDTTDLGLFWESYDDFDKTIASSASIVEQGAKALQGKEVDTDLVKKIARSMKKEYGSKIDLDTFSDNLTKVFAYMQTQEKADYEDMLRVMTEVAMPVIEESTEYDPAEVQQYKDFKAFLRNTRFKLDKEQKKIVEYYYDSYEKFRKKNFGTLLLTNDGMYLDQIWSEIVDVSNGYLSNDIDPEAMPIALMDALELMQPQLHNKFGADNNGVAMDLSLRIYEEYFKNQADSSVKALKSKMTHERAVFQEKVRKQYYEKLKVEKARMNRRAGEISKRQADQIAKVLAAQKNSELRKKKEQKLKQHRENIKKNGMNLMKWIESPTNQKHIPEKLRKLTLEFLNAIDFVSHRAVPESYTTKRWQELMKNVALQLKLAENAELDTGYEDFLMALDPDFLTDLNDFLKKTDGVVKLSEMNVDRLSEMEALDKLMQSMKTAVIKTNELDGNKQFEHTSQVSQATIRELQEKKDQKVRNTFFSKIRNTLNIDMIEPMSYFKMMGPAAESMYHELRDGFNVRTWHLQEAKNYMDRLLKDISKRDLKKWTGKNAEIHTFEVEHGDQKRELKLTTGQIMNLYLLGKRPQAKLHIMSGGIKAEDAGTGKNRFTQHKAIHITPQLYGEIIDKLTDEQRELADKMQRFLAENCAEWGNNTTMKLYGYNKFTEDRYWPIKTDENTNITNDKTTNNASLYAIRNQGMTKNIVKDAKNAVKIGDIMDVFVEHVTGMANYDAFAIPLTDCMKWYNYKNQAMVGDFLEADMVKEEISRVYGTKAKSYFTTLILDINGDVRKDIAENWQGKAISRYKAAAVGANLRVAIQQVTAIVRAAAVLNPVDITAALTRKPQVKKAKENSAIALWKSWGFFETNIGKSMKEIITGQSSLTEKVRDKSMVLAELGDSITWGYLWNACENEIRRKNKGLSKDSAEFIEKVRERFDQVIDETQVVDTVLHKSQLMRSDNALVKMEMSFMNEPQKTYNMLWRAAVLGGKKEFGKALLIYAATGLLTSLAASLMDAVRDDDEMKTFEEKYLKALTGIEDGDISTAEARDVIGSNLVDNLNMLGMMPYVKNIFSIISGFESERMDLAAMNDAIKTLQTLSKPLFGKENKKTVYGNAKMCARSLSRLTGIPAYNLMREAETLCETATNEKWQESE